ncbi:MAG TPA: patatin-like phospholipase family protein [Bacteroidales bacterium]|nr:patatin-like phospholipase family protein [Bacteroidales bacterium]
MRLSKISLGIFLTLILILTFFLFSDSKVRTEEPFRNIEGAEGTGTAIIMTGAGARIPQQVALLEELYDRGCLKDVVFISGVSAGALNAVVLNAILSGRMTWDEYKEILFKLENKDIFSIPEGKRLPLNTEPTRLLLKEVVEERLGYHSIGDLPFMTEISFSNYPGIRQGKKVYRMCSRKINSETDTTLNLVDILMATSAVPFAFPSVKINNVSTIPDLNFIDGGFSVDYLPFKALLDFQEQRGERVKTVYIISRKGGMSNSIGDELESLGIDNKIRLDKLTPSVDNLLVKVFFNRLEAFAKDDPEMIMRSYVWIPDFEQNFLMLNFNNLREQYTITKAWAVKNDPVSLGDYLLYNQLKNKR